MQFKIIGLGNPGNENLRARHNAGHFIVSRISKEHKIEGWDLNKKANAIVTKIKIEGSEVLLALSQVFMNKSGSVASKLMGTKKKKYPNLILIHDDIDLPIGTFKVSFGRGSAGHKGVESVFRALGSKNFFRFRIGVSPSKEKAGRVIAKKVKKGEKVIKHVLGDFKEEEISILRKKIYPKIDNAIKEIISGKRKPPKQ